MKTYFSFEGTIKTDEIFKNILIIHLMDGNVSRLMRLVA